MKNKILLITSYAPKDTLYGKNVGGVAGYAKNTVLHTEKTIQYTILAEQLNNKKEQYKENNNNILRIWKRNSLKIYPTLIKQLIQKRNTHKTLLIQFEFGIYGNEYNTGFFPMITLLSKLLRYKTIIVMHQVVENLTELSQHLNQNPKSLSTKFKSLLIKLYTKVLLFPVNSVIIFDEIHKNKLIKIIGERKEIIVIPHGVEEIDYFSKPSTTSSNKQTINILLFGYITWYKGTDLAINVFNKYCKLNPNTKLRLTIAGGQSATQKNNFKYQQYYKKVIKDIESNNKVSHTGFVEENDINKLFQKSDIILLPYRVLMSSSGPLSLAITNKKPFILSDKLLPYAKTSDFIKALSKTGITSKEISFSIGSFIKLYQNIEELRYNKKKLKQISSYLYNSRAWSKIGKQYIEVLTKKV